MRAPQSSASSSTLSTLNSTIESDTDGNDIVAITSGDPLALAEGILSKELNALSLEDRNSIQEEIHGVNCVAPEETPYLVEESLRKLASELDEIIPHSEKWAYLQAQTQSEASKTYINDKNFRLKFLRCELFDAPKAAKRMARTCEWLLKLFGPYALERQIKLSDFSSAERKAFRKGRSQILPYRDRIGRRVAIIFPGVRVLSGTNWSQIRLVQLKIFLYFSFVLASDVESQRKGVVMIFWFDREQKHEDIPHIARWKRGVKAHKISAVRCSAFHICSPDVGRFRLRWSVTILMISTMNRMKVKIHSGERVEVRYQLNGYGISTDTLPISWTGTVKIGYLKQWMRIREYLEDPSNSNDPSAPIECPELDDVIFKKGTSTIHHPGNARFRSMIQSMYEYEQSRRTREPEGGDGGDGGDFGRSHSHGMNDVTDQKVKSLLVFKFLEMFRKNELRALIWNEKYSWWNVVSNEKQIVKKVENMVNQFVFKRPNDESMHDNLIPQLTNVVGESKCARGQPDNNHEFDPMNSREDTCKAKRRLGNYQHHPQLSWNSVQSSTSAFQFSKRTRWEVEGTEGPECCVSRCR